jgi:hypothetical protein
MACKPTTKAIELLLKYYVTVFLPDKTANNCYKKSIHEFLPDIKTPNFTGK